MFPCERRLAYSATFKAPEPKLDMFGDRRRNFSGLVSGGSVGCKV